jgi:zinc transport system substrate-binding protein
MRHTLIAYSALILSLSINAHASPPAVAVDIAPLHSLVSQVMEGVGQPSLLIPAEASPHHHTLRPSQAKALADAEVVFWVGEGMTPWQKKALDNLAESALKVEVLEIEGTTTYAFREGATFESHDHGEDEHHKDEHHKDEHHEKGEHHDKEKDEHHKQGKHHDEEKDEHHKQGKHHDEEKDEHHKEGKHHDEEKDEHHDEHEGSDPHAWLDPENAKLWVNYINDILSKQDPENASTYSRNAAKATASLDTLIRSTRTKIDALSKPQFIVFHDAYQYFEKRFDIPAAGSITLGDAEDPSPARIKKIRDTVKKLGVTCVFTEPQYNPGIVKNVFEGTTISVIGVMDPLGASLATGSGHYQALIQGMVKSLSQCQ